MNHFEELHIVNNAEKKNIYQLCCKINDELFKRAEIFITNHKTDVDCSIAHCDLKIGSGSQYMDRGYYCPSRIQECLIDNVKRGKIMKKTTNRTKISHKYYFKDNQLHVIDHVYSGMREYLIYDENAIYGIVCDSDGSLGQFNLELYRDKKMAIYYTATYYADFKNDFGHIFFGGIMELFTYESDTLCDGKIYFLNSDTIDPNDNEQLDRVIDAYQCKLEMDIAEGKWKKKTDLIEIREEGLREP